MIPCQLERAADARDVRPEAPIAAGLGPGEVTIGGRVLVNLAGSDYLGFARDPRVLTAAHAALDEWGLGSAAGRVLSGNTAPHRKLEHVLAAWIGTADAALLGSCWTANAAIFAALAELAIQASTTLSVFSDRSNHASIIDAIGAQRRAVSHLGLFAHDDGLADLGRQLAGVGAASTKVIVTDGVFSMEGDQAPLAWLIELADAFGAMVIVDDSHGTGVVGLTGRGTAEAQDQLGRVDVVTGTLGKALGGAIGGFAAGPDWLMRLLRSTARPFVFSNPPPVAVIAGALAALDILEHDPAPLSTLGARVRRLRTGVEELGLRIHPGEHPIMPVMLGDEALAREAGEHLMRAGVFAPALTFPIVPRGEARLRLQVSAAHSVAAVDRVLDALASL